MTTEAFAGTELARRVREAAGRDALAHAIILSGEGDLTAAARYLAAAMECGAAERSHTGTFAL